LGMPADPPAGKEDHMRLGLRAILLIVAIVLFFVSMLVEDNQFDLLAIGLAVLAGAFLVGDLGLEGRMRGKL
jgi:hypothetical protein